MTTCRSPRLALLALAQLLAASPALSQSVVEFSGRIRPGSDDDAALRTAFHTFEAAAGQRIEVQLSSDEFDTVLRLHPPTGEPLENDDSDDGTNSSLTTFASTAGSWRVEVTSYDASGGGYDVTVRLGAIGTIRELRPGRLGDADSLSAKGQRYASQTVRIERPSQLLAEMTSEELVPMIVLISPGGERFSGEASEGSSTARAEVPYAEAGSWRVVASHAASSDSVGAYTLRLIETPAAGSSQIITGALADTDRRDLRGEYYDTHTVTGTAGRPITLELSSSDFDSYLSARSPSGRWYRDDDGRGTGSDARLELPAEAGAWTVIVTSFGADETGSYRLRVVR